MISISDTNGGISTQPRKKWKPAENHRTQTYLDLPESENPSEEPAPAGTRQRSKLQYFPIPRGKIVFSPFQKPSAGDCSLLFLPLYSPWHNSATRRSTVENWSNGWERRWDSFLVRKGNGRKTTDRRIGKRHWRSFGFGTSTKRITIGARGKRVPHVPKCPFSSFEMSARGFSLFGMFSGFRFPLSASGAKSMGTGKMRRESRSSFVSSTCGL